MIEYINIKNNLFSKNSKYSICSSLKYLSLFIFIFSFSVNAQDLTAGQQQWQQYVPNWFPLFSIAALIGFGVVGISFMLARVFMLPQLESWARNELFEVVSSIFLVLIIIVSLGIIDNIFIAATNKKPIDYSLDFTTSISNELMDRYIDSVKLGIAIGTLSGPPAQYLGDKDKKQPGQGGASGSQPGTGTEGGETKDRVFLVAIEPFKVNYLPFYAADVFNGHYNLFQSIALMSLGISLFSHAILEFINMIAIPVAVPLGLLLSMFAFSRKMGRTLIAFGVGLYIFVPLSIIIASTMYNSAFKADTSIPHIERPSGGNNVDTFADRLLALNFADFIIHLAIGIAGVVINKGYLVFIPACSVGATSLSSICGLAAPVCAVAFTVICSLFGSFSDTGQTADIIDKLLLVATVLKIETLSYILGVPISGQMEAIIPVIVSLSLTGTVSALIFHIIPSNVLTTNYLLPILNQLMNFGTYELSVIQFSLYAELNKALATKLSNIILAYTPYIMQYAVPVMLIPFIMIFIVITGIRSLSSAIGGEVQILGVSELI